MSEILTEIKARQLKDLHDLEGRTIARALYDGHGSITLVCTDGTYAGFFGYRSGDSPHSSVDVATEPFGIDDLYAAKLISEDFYRRAKAHERELSRAYSEKMERAHLQKLIDKYGLP
jgi:hypothetical protein